MWMRAPEQHVRPWKLAPGNALVIALCALITIGAGLAVNPFVTAAESARMRETPFVVQGQQGVETAQVVSRPNLMPGK